MSPQVKLNKKHTQGHTHSQQLTHELKIKHDSHESQKGMSYDRPHTFEVPV